jgi:release factor glutamine methyltransferase
VRRLLDQARCVLHSHGLMLIEIGAQQGDAVSALAEAAFPNASIQVLGDLAGLDRVIRIQCFTRTFD